LEEKKYLFGFLTRHPVGDGFLFFLPPTNVVRKERVFLAFLAQQRSWDQCYHIENIFAEIHIWQFNVLILCQNYHNIGFQEKCHFFRRQLRS
jgi:hypothetical protein